MPNKPCSGAEHLGCDGHVGSNMCMPYNMCLCRRGMAMAGVDKWLTPAEIETICLHYTATKTASMDVMHYAQFLADVDEIFTKPVRELQRLFLPGLVP